MDHEREATPRSRPLIYPLIVLLALGLGVGWWIVSVIPLSFPEIVYLLIAVMMSA